jgi:hypothetical protein
VNIDAACQDRDDGRQWLSSPGQLLGQPLDLPSDPLENRCCVPTIIQLTA